MKQRKEEKRERTTFNLAKFSLSNLAGDNVRSKRNRLELKTRGAKQERVSTGEGSEQIRKFKKRDQGKEGEEGHR